MVAPRFQSILFRGLLLILLACIGASAEAQNIVRGSVFDASNGQPLVAAHVEVLDLRIGAITNVDGAFLLSVAELPVTLRVQYIGYESRRIEVTTVGESLRVAMVPAVYDLAEIEVSTEDLGRRIMREVIAEKARRRDSLQTFRRDGYVRLSLEHRGEIQVISQHLFSDYYHRPLGRRTIARATSETSSIYTLLGIDPLGQRIDLNDDLVTINDLAFIGPTHPDALAKYNFVLGGRRTVDDLLVYDIFVSPKTQADATFTGRISVLDSMLVMIDVRLRPSRHVVFGTPVKTWDVFYSQQYSRITDDVWLPVDLRMEGRIHVDPDDQGYEEAHLALVSQLSGYVINDDVADLSVFDLDTEVIRDSAFVLAELPFLPNGNMIPLTPRETEALGALMQTRTTIEDALLSEHTRPQFARFERERNSIDDESVQWPVIYGYRPWLRFNRVDGFLLGAGRNLTFSPQLDIEVRAAQTTGFEKIRFLGKATYRRGSRITVRGSYRADTAPTVDDSRYSTTLTSVSPLTGGRDYFDHYWSKKLTSEFEYSLESVRFRLTASTDRSASVDRTVTNLWSNGDAFRPNPGIGGARNNSVEATVSIGDPANRFGLDASNRVEATIKHSNAEVLQSDYSYTQVGLAAETKIETLFRNRPTPSNFRIRVDGTANLASNPEIKRASTDGSIAGFSAFGTLRSLRDRYYTGSILGAVFWEHSFGPVPFELAHLRRLRFLTEGIRIHGSHAWFEDDGDHLDELPSQTTNHHEIGFGLASIFRLPLRIDISFRLDKPGTFVTVGIERLWPKN